MYQDILIHVTGFFREPEVFRELKNKIVPRLLAERGPLDPLRVWVAGCSTGEEAYSIAIALLESIGDCAKPPLQVFATDLSERAVQRARAGPYPDSVLGRVSPERLERFFVKTKDGYQVSKAVCDLCVFARHDLVKDPPFSRLDLISCRNVLIFMGPELQSKVIAVFHYALKPHGYLILGRAESPGAHSKLFTLEDRTNKICARRQGPAAALPRLYEMRAVHGDRAKKEQAPVSQHGVHYRNAVHIRVDIEVIPIYGRQINQSDFLIVFMGARAAREDAAADTRGFLRSVARDLEAANEELRAANEEIVSNNEELQSTNEELVTLNEALQSRNAELAEPTTT